MHDFLEWTGIGGLIAACGALLGFGSARATLAEHAREIEKMKVKVELVVRLEERIIAIQNDLAEIKHAVGK